MVYKGLDLDPLEMMMVIAEMSNILKFEVADLEGSTPRLESRSSSKRLNKLRHAMFKKNTHSAVRRSGRIQQKGSSTGEGRA